MTTRLDGVATEPLRRHQRLVSRAAARLTRSSDRGQYADQGDRLNVEGVTPAFFGGTSLATAWQLIHRFSEDLDFEVTVQAESASAGRKIRSAYREPVIDAPTKAGFTLDGVPLVGNMSRFFRVSFHYGLPSLRQPAYGLPFS